MTLNGRTFIEKLESHTPLYLAEEGDPVGLHIGTLDKELSKVMMTLDVRPEVVQEAVAQGVDLIVAKHPPIFRPLKHLLTDNPQERMYSELLKHDIAVYAAHTNMDIIEGGLNDWFCEKLDVRDTTFLRQTHEIHCKKLIVFVPETHADEMRQALGEIGAGRIGENYSHCSFSSSGEGRFKPINRAQPTIGKVGQPEIVSEVKIEVVFPETLERDVLRTMYAVHPYEEPAFDLLTLDNFTKTYGIGRIGDLPEAVPLTRFIETVKQAFALDGLRLITDNDEKMVKRVAICGGSGEKFYRDALYQQADVYITGDVYYHTAHDMIAEGLTVLDPGHYIEFICKEKYLALFNQWKQSENWDVEFIASTINTNPFQWR
ncbi:Nif3-like dinuclear metal center hexameric protein [Vagococcus acidifermentans]|uniref:GTP cyclohydrolase 1 type 2 homolog n=1 Tax=Vagococcus acidifermentans TaxID=564710 RepID=A0A430AY26_9ENTE|nr:Nif3-like dinuclear metal center hexameric protein [Vagococcus acidifermentans]RSU12980.1 Nif3-like dinuclear metal center hexameric protein [Vagococcus acidifermentans]